MKRLILIIIGITILVNLNAQDCEIEKITDKILSCKCYYNEEHRAFYVISENGLVLVDTYYYPWLTQESKDLVYAKIGRNDFKYLLHTHGHGCHVGGDLIYKDVTIIGHDSVKGHIDKLKNYHLKEYNRLKDECLTDSSKIKEYKDYEMLVNIPYPTQTFSDSILIKLNDMTIQMKYFGFSGHSNDEALIYIPEEKTLIIGQIFGRSYFLPVVKECCTESDLKRKVTVLSDFISKDVEHILSNHQGEIKKEDLIFARDYLRDILTLVPTLIKEKKDLNYIKDEFRLDKKYPELAKRHEISEDIVKNNDSNIESIWKMIIKNGN